MTTDTPAPESPGRTPPSRFGPMLLAIGPGIVVSGSVIGSGELINVPVQAATFGFVLFWAVILSCVIKFFLQVELGRHCLVHNRTPIQALNTCPGPKFRKTGWLGIVYIGAYTISVVTVGGIMAATAGLFQSLFPLEGLLSLEAVVGSADSAATASKNVWAIIIFAIIFVLLWRGIYGELEKLIAVLVCGFSLSVVVALVLLLVFPDPRYPITTSNFASGWTFSLGDLAPAAAGLAVVSLLGALGTTANEMFMYPYWVLEKGYAENLGPKDSPGWQERAAGWIRVLRLDAGVATLLATVITLAYFLVASAVFNSDLLTLNPDGGSPDVVDYPAICRQLEQAETSDKPGDRAAKRIWSLLPPPVQRSTAAVARSETPDTKADTKADTDTLLALNALIDNRDFYQVDSFADLVKEEGADGKLKLAGMARQLIEQADDQGIDSLSHKEVRRLNRQLLDATFYKHLVPTVPSGMSIVHQLSRIYTDTYGAWSYSIFMFGGFCTLFSTIVVVVAASGRMWTDLLSSMGVLNYDNPADRRRYNRIFQTLYLLAFLAITWFIPTTPEFLVILGQAINGGFNTPLLMFGICWLAFHTDKRLRMSTVTAVLLLLTVFVIAACLLVTLFVQAGH